MTVVLVAAIMCGGKATRMQQQTDRGGSEKPLLNVGGVPMVECVISALAGSNRFGRIIAAVSPNTPETKEFLKSKGIEIIETSGVGYPQDLSWLLSKLKPERVMVVPADIPLLDAQAVGDIVDSASNKQEPAVSIVLEKEFVENIGAKPSVVFGRYCHSGITIFDTSKVVGETVQERYLVMNRKEIALNVNTKQELELAEKLYSSRAPKTLP
ncbi:NTP transferase domain-containing protein [Candidatus Nitrososphaera gargensis]|nr:NTP transferase domain-containing protein [Candidatus Nitrososphaera gargensis]